MEIVGLWMAFGLAWVAVAIALLLSIIFVLRMMRKKDGRFAQAVSKLNRSLRKHHIALGVALIAIGLVHGLFSSQSVFSLNIGTVCWIVSILLGVSWLIRKRLANAKGWMQYHRILTMAFLALILWHIVDVGGIQAPQVLFGSPAPQTQLDQMANEPSEAIEQGCGTLQEQPGSNAGDAQAETTAAPTTSFNGVQLKDGTYTGEATGYRPGIQVSVTVKNNTITNVEVTGHSEVNSRYYSRPISIVPQEIVEEQSTDVDTVTSGTFTSIGIMNAVNDALRQAVVSGELPKDLQLPINRRRH